MLGWRGACQIIYPGMWEKKSDLEMCQINPELLISGGKLPFSTPYCFYHIYQGFDLPVN